MQNPFARQENNVFPITPEAQEANYALRAKTDATLKIIDEVTKQGTRLLVAYVVLDTWRKLAVAFAEKSKD